MADGGPRPSTRVTEVVVLTTAMLTFISFWRAGAVVLCDMASTAWYVGGIAEQAIGKSAPWFILAVMAFSACMLAVYLEGSSMFVRGGVYKVVKEAMGGTLAKVSVSALMFDYVLTGPISSVSAGQYLAGFLNATFPILKIGWKLDPNAFSVLFALIVTAYFWRINILGIEESSDRAMRIIQLTGLMALVLFGWCAYTLRVRGFEWPPFSLSFGKEALGWLDHFEWAKTVGAAGVLVGLGHAFLGMSGLESLAQVYREMEAPKLKNLKRAAAFIFCFAFLLTTLSTFFAVTIIPDAERVKYLDNLLGGLSMSLEGPRQYLLILQAVVVLVGVLILAGAVNTSVVGANGVLNRLAEDGVMADWFRWLHPKYGTTHRMIHLVVALQALTILVCRGDVYLLGEAYAFGVVWSFVFKAASLIILRFKDRSLREWMVPVNLRWGGVRAPEAEAVALEGAAAAEGETEGQAPVPEAKERWLKPPLYLPVGLSAIFTLLILVALTNLLTKKVATIWGVSFTLAFYLVFHFSEKLNRRRAEARAELREKFNLAYKEDIKGMVSEVEYPERILVAIRDPKNMYPLNQVLERADPENTEIVVLHSKRARGLHLSGEVTGMGPEEELLFSNVIAAAEKQGKTVIPMMVVSNDPAYAVAQAAQAIGATQVVLGASATLPADIQLERLAMTMGAVGHAAGRPIKLLILRQDGVKAEVDL